MNTHAPHPNHAFALLGGIYGLVAGLTEGSERALVASSVPDEARGRVLGLYNLLSGVGLLVASVLAGFLWEQVSPRAALLAGGLFAAVAAAALVRAPVPAWRAGSR